MAQQNQSFWDLVFNRNQGRSSGSKNSGYAWPAMYQPSFWDRVLYPQGFPGQDPNKARMNKYGYADTGASDAAQEAYAKSVDNYMMKTAAEDAFRPGAAAAPAPSTSKPATKLSSSQAITDKISAITGVPDYGAQPTSADFLPPAYPGVSPGGEPQPPAEPQSAYRPPPFNVPLHPPEMAEPAADTGERNIPPGPLPGGIMPSWEGVQMPQASAGATPFGGATYGGNKFGGNTFGGNRFGGNTYGGRTGRDVLQAVKGWNGKVYAQGGPIGYFAGGHNLRTRGGPIPTVEDYRDGKGPPRAPDGRTQHFAWAALIPAAMSMVSSMAKGSGGGGGGGGGMQAPQAPGPVAPPSMAAPAQIKPVDLIPGDEPERQAYGGRSGFMRGGYPELYNKPVRQGYFSTGGGNNYVEGDGQGSGRSDHIDALLSPGEYVMDAETVSLMGDGDNESGARKFDKLRKNIRIHKGKQLAKGEFSPQAKKNAEEYLARDAISDGFRQHGRG